MNADERRKIGLGGILVCVYLRLSAVPFRRIARCQRIPSPLAMALILAASLSWALSGCEDRHPSGATNPAPALPVAGPAWFENIAAQAGIDVVSDSGHRDRCLLPESVCGGAALFDMDNDGWLDLYIVQCGHVNDPPERRPGNSLYRNLGNGRFTDVTAGSGADDHGLGMGVATGDYDNDGDVDLYIANLGPNVLLRNDGGAHFADVTAAAGVGDGGFGSGAAFLDYDADGNLDLFVVNYVNWSLDAEGYCAAPDGGPDYCNPKTYQAPSVPVLYHSNGDGTFTNVTVPAGMGNGPGNGLGVVCGDFNGDGLIDIYVANDASQNRMWINLGSGSDNGQGKAGSTDSADSADKKEEDVRAITPKSASSVKSVESPARGGRGSRFEERAMELGCAIDESGAEKAGMGVMAVDFDDDGDLDLLVCNLYLEADSFYRNEGSYFADATSAHRLAVPTRRSTRFGLAMLDFDNDGWLDMYEANGRVNRNPPLWNANPYAEPNLLMRGGPDGRFEEVTPRGGTSAPLIDASRAAAFGDLDNDGGIDIVVINRDAQPYLLHNIVANRGHWLMCRVLNEHQRDALGATVVCRIGQRTVRRDVRTAYSYFAANDPRVHFGLGAQAQVEDVTVIWPDQARESFGPQNADQIVTLRRGAGRQP